MDKVTGISVDHSLILRTARKCWELGLNAVPSRQDKRPAGYWEELQKRSITESEFINSLNSHGYGLGIVCGKVSQQLEVIDIDQKYCLTGNLTHNYFQLINDTDPDLFNSLYIVKSQSGGFHLYYRCEEIEGSQKLAQRPATDDELRENPKAKVRVLIETRGEGGFIVCPPTPGYEPWQKNEIPTISIDQRNFLLNAARSFNEIYEETKTVKQPYTRESPFDVTPWDDYDQRGDILDLLAAHSWTVDKKSDPRIYFTRPGKGKGVSADYHKTLRLFKSWSTSVSDFEAEKAYSHTAVYAYLECGGDFQKAAAELESKGYGKRKPPDYSYRKIAEPNGVHPIAAGPAITADQDPMRGVYIPTWDNRPEQRPDLVTLSGTGILTHQNITGLIALPGVGKSSSVEAIIASYINPECDSLGFAVDSSCTGILAIDNERTDTDVWNSFHRYHKRAGIDRSKEPGNVTLVGLRFVARLPERKKIIEQLIIEKKPSLVIIDGAGDLVTDTNDLAEAIECRIWMRELTVIYGVSIFTTLHPNPNSNKPRGHQGSEICREAECVLLAKQYDGDIKVLTTDFEHGKNRNNPKLTTAYMWSEEKKMFVSADYDEVQGSKVKKKAENSRDKLVTLAKEVLPPPAAMKHDDLRRVIEERYEVSEKTARRRIAEMTELTLIKNHDDGYYRMIMS